MLFPAGFGMFSVCLQDVLASPHGSRTISQASAIHLQASTVTGVQMAAATAVVRFGCMMFSSLKTTSSFLVEYNYPHLRELFAGKAPFQVAVTMIFFHFKSLIKLRIVLLAFILRTSSRKKICQSIWLFLWIDLFSNCEFIRIKSAFQYSCRGEVGALRDSLISQAFENSFFLLLLIWNCFGMERLCS